MKTISVDHECVELAWYFINDEETRKPMGTNLAVASARSLAEHIQRAVDDWFATQNLAKPK